MIGYITLGTNNLEETAEFYDSLFESLGARRLFTAPTFVGWCLKEDSPMFSIVKPYDGNLATVGNGVMIALEADSKEKVDELHAKAIALGACNEGDPGMRDGGYYCAYFRDPEGNKINFHCMPVA